MATSLRALLSRLHRGTRRPAVPLVDAASLGAAARRTRLVRLSLGLTLVAVLIVAFMLAPREPGRRFIPADAVGIVVLDLSSSVRPSTYRRIGLELAGLAATRQRIGLVLFSDVAYEALPTGTPASELKPVLRFFLPPESTGPEPTGAAASAARSPWEQWFSAGTKISTGLFLAYDMLRNDHVKRGAVVLISDLDDDPNDLAPLAESVAQFAENGIPLKVVALDPTPANAEFFKNLLGSGDGFREARLPTGAEGQGRVELEGSFPTALFAAALCATALLALGAWWAEPLRWERPA